MKKYLNKKTIKLSVIILLSILFIVYAIISITYKNNETIHLIPKHINPILLHITDNLEIRWYAVCLVGGACLLSVYGFYRYLKPGGMDSDTCLTGVTLGILFGILGGRIYYVIFNPIGINFDEGVFKALIDIINPASGGLAIHGAFYATVIYVIVFCKVKHFKFLEVVEITLPVFMLAQVVGRWGNFFNQEAFGPLVNGYTTGPLTDAELLSQRETLRHLLVPNFIIDNMYINSGVRIPGYYHPTFFYEGVLNLIGALSYIQIRKKSDKVYVGDGVCFYLTWYGIVRLFIELLRQDPLTFELFGITFKAAIVTSVLFIILGILLFILRRVFKFYLVPCNSYLYGRGSIIKDEYLKKEEQEEKEEINTNKVIFMDCDGTLVDTFKHIENITKKTFDKVLPDYKYTIEEIHSFFGPVVDETFKKYANSNEQYLELLNTYFEYDKEYQSSFVCAYDGIYETLSQLHENGYKIVVVSNKTTESVLRSLEISGIYEFIEEIAGSDKLIEPKPNTTGIVKLMEKYNIDKAIIVGDSIIDIETANNLKTIYPNVLGIGVSWCKTTKEELLENNANFVIEKPNELIEKVQNYYE